MDFGHERPDLYSTAPEKASELSYYDLLLKLIGPPLENAPVFRFGGRRERISERGGPYWVARLRRFVAVAPDRYIEQARRDWRAIYYLIEIAERVDWNKAPPLTPFGTKVEPPSWVARKARRVRRKPPPVFVSQPIERWRRSSNFRSYVFSLLLVWRRLCARASIPQLPDIILGIAQQWLEGLPQIEPQPDKR